MDPADIKRLQEGDTSGLSANQQFRHLHICQIVIIVIVIGTTIVSIFTTIITVGSGVLEVLLDKHLFWNIFFYLLRMLRITNFLMVFLRCY